MHKGAKVKILAGDLKGEIGIVINVHKDMFKVKSGNLHRYYKKIHLEEEFCIGTRVIIVSDPDYQGLTGTICNISDEDSWIILIDDYDGQITAVRERYLKVIDRNLGKIQVEMDK